MLTWVEPKKDTRFYVGSQTKTIKMKILIIKVKVNLSKLAVNCVQ